MKLFRRWSFLIILAITGIVYCGMDRELLKAAYQEKLDSLGEATTAEGWQQPQEESLSGSVSGNSVPEGAMDGEGQAGDASQADPGEPGSQGGDTEPPGIAEPGSPDEGATGEAGGEEVPPEPTPEPEPEIVIGRVEEDYFADALFLGDSRTVGLAQFGSLGDYATFYASTGMTIYKLFGAEIVEMPEQPEKITVEEALQHQSFRKIYIMMGINEMGRGTPESFAETFGEVIAHLQELQPEAIIYIESIIKVTTDRSAKGDYINNEGIDARNEALSRLADGKTIFYLDVNQAICDEDGGLVKDYTSDGVHLKAKYISLWEEYLKDNAVLLD